MKASGLIDAGLCSYVSGYRAEKGAVGFSSGDDTSVRAACRRQDVRIRLTTGRRVRSKGRALDDTRLSDPATTVSPKIQRPRCRLNT